VAKLSIEIPLYGDGGTGNIPMAASCRISEPRIAPSQASARQLEGLMKDLTPRALHFMPGPWYKFLKCSVTERRELMVVTRTSNIDSNIVLAMITDMIAGWDVLEGLE